MRFCFIIEEQYREHMMPMAVVQQLLAWEHEVTLLEPRVTITRLSDLMSQGYDAYVLKTVSGGPGMSLIEAAGAVGIPTVNNCSAIRMVRDKAVAAAFARHRGIPFPVTYFVANPRLLTLVPPEIYPLVFKPSNGSACRGVFRLNSIEDLTSLDMETLEASHSYFLAQSYVNNSGFDVKLYVIGRDVHAVAKKSPLHPTVQIEEGPVPVTPELRDLALAVGDVFRLDLYGVDVVETPQGWVALDINDFPSFGGVQHAVSRIAEFILRVAEHAKKQRTTETVPILRTATTM